MVGGGAGRRWGIFPVGSAPPAIPRPANDDGGGGQSGAAGNGASGRGGGAGGGAGRGGTTAGAGGATAGSGGRNGRYVGRCGRHVPAGGCADSGRRRRRRRGGTGGGGGTAGAGGTGGGTAGAGGTGGGTQGAAARAAARRGPAARRRVRAAARRGPAARRRVLRQRRWLWRERWGWRCDGDGRRWCDGRRRWWGGNGRRRHVRDGTQPCGGALVGTWSFVSVCLNEASLMEQLMSPGCPSADRDQREPHADGIHRVHDDRLRRGLDASLFLHVQHPCLLPERGNLRRPRRGVCPEPEPAVELVHWVHDLRLPARVRAPGLDRIRHLHDVREHADHDADGWNGRQHQLLRGGQPPALSRRQTITDMGAVTMRTNSDQVAQRQ